jgi:hypothetical protein
MVGHEGIAERFNGENAGQFFQATADPITAMGIVPSGPAIPPAQMIATHAATDSVKHLNVGFGKDFTAIDTWHTSPLSAGKNQSINHRKKVKVHGTLNNMAP